MMLVSALILAVTAVPDAPPPPSVSARAQVVAMVQIIQAAEIRGGLSDTPHQRRTRLDERGGREILLEFE